MIQYTNELNPGLNSVRIILLHERGPRQPTSCGIEEHERERERDILVAEAQICVCVNG